MARCPFRKRHADLVDHVALQLPGGALREVEVLVVFAFLASPVSVAKETQVPCGRHAAVEHLSSQKLHQARDEKAGFCGVLGQRVQRRDQLGSQSLIGIQVQLPRVLDHQVVDGPVPLRAVVFEGMLDHLRSVLLADSHCVVTAEGVDNVQIIGDLLRLGQRGP